MKYIGDVNAGRTDDWTPDNSLYSAWMWIVDGECGMANLYKYGSEWLFFPVDSLERKVFCAFAVTSTTLSEIFYHLGDSQNGSQKIDWKQAAYLSSVRYKLYEPFAVKSLTFLVINGKELGWKSLGKFYRISPNVCYRCDIHINK